MSSVAQIRSALYLMVAGVPEVGLVYDRERYVRDEAKFRTLFIYTPAGGEPQVRGWWLRRTKTQEYSANTQRVINVHSWVIRGYMALNDQAGSELVFDGLVESIRHAYRADPTLGGVCQLGPLQGADGSDGIQLDDTGPVSFCGVLCHSAALSLRTWSYI